MSYDPRKFKVPKPSAEVLLSNLLVLDSVYDVNSPKKPQENKVGYYQESPDISNSERSEFNLSQAEDMILKEPEPNDTHMFTVKNKPRTRASPLL